VCVSYLATLLIIMSAYHKHQTLNFFQTTNCNRHQEAESIFDDVVKMLSKAHDGVHPDVAVAFGNMAVCLRNTFQYGRSIPLHERAVKIMSAVLSKDSPETVYQKAQLGVTLIRSGDRNRGQPMLMDALGQMEKLGYTSTHLWVKTFKKELP
jgi:hypothetical protein